MKQYDGYYVHRPVVAELLFGTAKFGLGRWYPTVPLSVPNVTADRSSKASEPASYYLTMVS